MPGYFYCRLCDKRTRKNPRIKINQGYSRKGKTKQTLLKKMQDDNYIWCQADKFIQRYI